MESEKVVFSAEGTPHGDKNNLLFVDTDIVLDLLNIYVKTREFHGGK